MTNDDKSRFTSMGYDAMAPDLVPCYDFFQGEMIRQSAVEQRENPTVIDLGAGGGRLLEKVLSRNPSAVGYWVDFSPEFMAVARARLDRFGRRVRYLVSSLEEEWESHIDGPVDCIYSMSAIHHLENLDKQFLYRRCFRVLANGGWFINTDEMKTVNDDAHLSNLQFWVQHVDQRRDSIPADRRLAYDQWRTGFQKWKQRNIEQRNQPKTRGDDLHEFFLLQMQWLKEAGFAKVDSYVKYHLWCSIGGQKPF